MSTDDSAVAAEKVEELVAQHGDQAYFVAIKLGKEAMRRCDVQLSKTYALTAIQLIHKGYHRNRNGETNG